MDTIAPIVTLAGLPGRNQRSEPDADWHTRRGVSGVAVNHPDDIRRDIHHHSAQLRPEQRDESGTFSFNVQPGHGINTFEAVATDLGAKTGTAEETSVGDFTAPSGIVQIIGVTSEGEALVGDDFFVVVHATDNIFGSGVATIETDTATH